MKRIFNRIVICSVLFLCLFPGIGRALVIPDNVPSWKNMDKNVLAKILETGELISVDYVGKEKIEMVSIAMLADAPPEKVWKTVTDFEGYTNLMPESLKTTITEKDKNTQKVKFVVNVLKIGTFAITANYTLKYVLDAPKRADISWVDGDVKNVAGYWELYPVAGGKKTVAIYAITSDLASTKMVGSILAKQPATVMAINLSSAIIFTKRIMEQATGKKRPSAPAGSAPKWKSMDEKTLYKLLNGGRVGFISRIGNQEVATAGVLVKKDREVVWKCLTNFEKYPGKIQQVTSAKVLEKNDKMARVEMRTEIISLGLIKIATEGVTRYHFDKPGKMWSEDDKKPDAKLFNRWELRKLSGGKETGLFNEAVSDISGMGKIASLMLEKLPALQISIDLSQTMILANEIQKWAQSGK